MNNAAKLLVPLLLALLAATNTAWYMMYTSNNNIYAASTNDKCTQRIHELEKLIDKLTKQVRELDDNNTKLILKYRNLVNEYNKLVDMIKTANQTLKRNIALLNILYSLNQTITTLYEYTTLHAYYTPRVRALFQTAGLGNLVLTITGTPSYVQKDADKHLKQLYKWVTKNIQAAPDQPFAAIRSPEYVNVSGKILIAGFRIDIVDNYIQSPVETLKRRAGDCEDIALLLAALYKSYLSDVGDSWVLCLFTNETNHCMALAYDRVRRLYVLADPVYLFYDEGKSPRSLVDDWLAYMGLRATDVTRALIFNNNVYKEGNLIDIISLIKNISINQNR